MKSDEEEPWICMKKKTVTDRRLHGNHKDRLKRPTLKESIGSMPMRTKQQNRERTIGIMPMKPTHQNNGSLRRIEALQTAGVSNAESWDATQRTNTHSKLQECRATTAQILAMKPRGK